MGPRPFGRGMHADKPHEPQDDELQWGRDLSVAEWRQCRRCSGPTVCFNGAATFRSRNAEIKRVGQCARLASMGPRPFGRGMSMPSAGTSATRPLQWGRDLSVAEWRSLTTRSTTAAALQWGRDLSVAECAVHRAAGLMKESFNGAATFRSRNECSLAGRPPLTAASMGPRPFGRGMERSLESGTVRRPRFNGAATFRSRNVRRRPRCKAQMPRFNGAATFRSRNAGLDVSHYRLDALLQWGRDLSVAECPQSPESPPPTTGFNGAATFRSRNAHAGGGV